MTRLALASLRARRTAFLACFLSVFLGGTVIGAFATLLDDASGRVSATDRSTLVTIGAVVGGWGLVIVLFSVASLLTLTVRQRGAETGLLRTIGATPRQIKRLVLAETMTVALAAVLLAAAPAWLVGAAVLWRLRDAGMLAASVRPGHGAPALVGSSLALLLVCALAVGLAGRRTTRARPMGSTTVGTPAIGRWRIIAAGLLLVVGVSYSMLTVTVMAHTADPLLPMSTAGPASVFCSLALAIAAPLLLRVAARAAGPLRVFGASGQLAVHDLRTRSHLLAGALAPILIFVGIGTGTIYLVRIQNAAAGPATTTEARNLELLNYIVVGLIAVFAAIMIVTTLAAVIAARRREFGQLRLAGATLAQVRTAMLLEGGFVAGTGIAFGVLAALATVLPYSWLKLARLVPHVGIGPFAGVAAAALLLTLVSGHLLTSRAVRGSALRAVTRVTA